MTASRSLSSQSCIAFLDGASLQLSATIALTLTVRIGFDREQRIAMLGRGRPPLEKYLAEVGLQRFGIGRLTTEADIAIGTDHIQTLTASSIAVM